jgi:hypothetical protein
MLILGVYKREHESKVKDTKKFKDNNSLIF